MSEKIKIALRERALNAAQTDDAELMTAAADRIAELEVLAERLTLLVIEHRDALSDAALYNHS